MKFDLTDQVAVVTGGTRGIGRAIVEAFIEAGASVVLSGRSEEKGKRAEGVERGRRASGPRV